MGARAGDFKRSHHYSGDEYLQWQDIRLAVTTKDGKPTLTMLVKLLWVKNHKQDSTAHAHELHQLDDYNSIVDPTKLCVAYAMRIGLVQQTTWQELIDTAMQRPSRRIVWTKPDAPVFFAWTKSQRLDFERPAGIDQQRRFLCDAADLVGMTQVPVTHDIRRGAASDLFHLQTDVGDMNSVRRTLGHSMSAMNRGTTDEYIGRSHGDSWGARLNAEKDADPFGVQIAAESFKKRKVRTEDIDKYCVDNHLDKKGMNRGTTDNYIGRTRGDS